MSEDTNQTKPPPPLPPQPSNPQPTVIPPLMAPLHPNPPPPMFHNPNFATPDARMQVDGHVIVSQDPTVQHNYYYESINGYQQPNYQIQQGFQQTSQPVLIQQPIPVYRPLMDTNSDREPQCADNGPSTNHIFMRINEIERKLNLVLKNGNKPLECRSLGSIQDMRENQQMILARMDSFESNLTSIAVSMARIASQNMSSRCCSNEIPNNDQLPRRQDSSIQISLEESDPGGPNVSPESSSTEVIGVVLSDHVVNEENPSLASETAWTFGYEQTKTDLEPSVLEVSNQIADHRSKPVSPVLQNNPSHVSVTKEKPTSCLNATEFPALVSDPLQKKPKQSKVMPVKSDSKSQSHAPVPHILKSLTLKDFLPNAGKQKDKNHGKPDPVVNKQSTRKTLEAHNSKHVSLQRGVKPVVRGIVNGDQSGVRLSKPASFKAEPEPLIESQISANKSNKEPKKLESTGVPQTSGCFTIKKDCASTSKANNTLKAANGKSQNTKSVTGKARKVKSIVSAPELLKESMKSEEQVQCPEERNLKTKEPMIPATETVLELEAVLEVPIEEDKSGDLSNKTFGEPNGSDEPVKLTKKQKYQLENEMKKAAKKEQQHQNMLAEKAKEQQFLEALLTFTLDEEELKEGKVKSRKKYLKNLTKEQQEDAFAIGLSDFLRIDKFCEGRLAEYTYEQSFLRGVVMSGKQPSDWCRMQKMLNTRDRAQLKRYAKTEDPLAYLKDRMSIYNDQDVSASLKFFFCIVAHSDEAVVKWDSFVLGEAAKGAEESQIEQNDKEYMMLVLKNEIPE